MNTCEFCCKPLKRADIVDIPKFKIQLVSMLDYLNLNSGMLQGENSACQGCTEKIISAHTFKKNCAQLGKDLPVHDSYSTKVDFRKLLQGKGKLVQEVEDENQVCRLCWAILECDAVLSLTELLEKENMTTVFREHIPEINLQAVKNPVICGICTNDLNNFKDLLFLSGQFENVREGHTNLRREENAIPNIEEDDSGNVHVSFGGERDHDVFGETVEFEAKVKIEPADIKGQPQSIVEQNQLKHEEIHIKSEEMEVDRATAESADWRCDRSNQEREERKEIQLHERAESSNAPKEAGNRGCGSNLVHEDASEVDLYKCPGCSFATERAGDLKKHMLVHNSKSGFDLFMCQECPYATKYAGFLIRHMSIHKAKSEGHLYKCHECSYEVKRAQTLKRHMLMHTTKPKADLYKCHECPYTTKLARSLENHMLEHKQYIIPINRNLAYASVTQLFIVQLCKKIA